MHNSIPEKWSKTELKRNHILYTGDAACAMKLDKEIFFIENTEVTKHEGFDDGVVAHERIHEWIWMFEHPDQSP